MIELRGKADGVHTPPERIELADGIHPSLPDRKAGVVTVPARIRLNAKGGRIYVVSKLDTAHERVKGESSVGSQSVSTRIYPDSAHVKPSIERVGPLLAQ